MSQWAHSPGKLAARRCCLAHDGQVRSPSNLSGTREPDEDAVLTEAVRKAQQGDEGAFRVIYRATQPGLIRYLWVLTGDAAEDVASETWLQIARDLGSFKGDAAGFRGWAATIARHRALDHVRSQRRRPQAEGSEDDLAGIAAAEDTAGSVMESLATRDALAMIARLPRDQAEAVLLRAIIGLDSKTAGRVLGKRAGAVRTAAYRGLHTLAAYLEDPGATRATTQTVTEPVAKAVTLQPRRALRDMR